MFCQCPVCHSSIQMCQYDPHDDFIRCKYCHTMFITPPTTPTVSESGNLASIAHERQVRGMANRPTRRQVRKQHHFLGLISLCGLAALVMLVGAIFLLSLGSSAAPLTVNVPAPRTELPAAESSGELFPDVKTKP